MVLSPDQGDDYNVPLLGKKRIYTIKKEEFLKNLLKQGCCTFSLDLTIFWYYLIFLYLF